MQSIRRRRVGLEVTSLEKRLAPSRATRDLSFCRSGFSFGLLGIVLGDLFEFEDSFRISDQVQMSRKACRIVTTVKLQHQL